MMDQYGTKIPRSMNEREFEALRSSRITFYSGCDLYIKAYLIPNKCATSATVITRYLQQVWEDRYPGVPVNDITSIMVENMWRVYQRGSKRTMNPTKPTSLHTVYRYHNRFMAILRFLTSRMLMSAEVWIPLSMMRLPRGCRNKSQPSRKLVTDEEMQAIIDYEPNESARDIYKLIDLCGARPGELTSMYFDQIDRSDPEIWFYRAPQHKTLYLTNERWLAFGPEGQEILWRHAGKKRRERCPVFQNDNGEDWTTDALRQRLGKVCRLAGVFPNVTARDIRRRWSNRVNAAHGAEAAALALGHSLETARRFYHERRLDALRVVAKEMG